MKRGAPLTRGVCARLGAGPRATRAEGRGAPDAPSLEHRRNKTPKSSSRRLRTRRTSAILRRGAAASPRRPASTRAKCDHALDLFFLPQDRRDQGVAGAVTSSRIASRAFGSIMAVPGSLSRRFRNLLTEITSLHCGGVGDVTLFSGRVDPRKQRVEVLEFEILCDQRAKGGDIDVCETPPPVDFAGTTEREHSPGCTRPTLRPAIATLLRQSRAAALQRIWRARRRCLSHHLDSSEHCWRVAERVERQSEVGRPARRGRRGAACPSEVEAQF
jgi:hypothetical protein